MIEKQFTLYVENRPGALAKVTKLLGSSRINIEGISIAVSGDVGLIQLVVSHAARAQKMLSKARIPFTVQKVSVLRLPNRPGALAALAQKLASRNVNLNYIYSTACSSCGGDSTVVLSGDNLRQIEALGKR